MTVREILQQALDALQQIVQIEDKMYGNDWQEIEEAREIAKKHVEDIRAHLAQPAQEPVNWLSIAKKHGYSFPDKRMEAFVLELLK